MENSHIEIHDPFTNHRDSRPTSDCNNMQETPEFKLLRAFAQRRRRADGRSPVNGGSMVLVGQMGDPHGPPEDANTAVKGQTKRRRRGWKRLGKILSCIRPQEKQTGFSPTGNVTCRRGDFRSGQESEDDKLENAASRLAEIADEIPFVRPEVEADSPDDDEEVEKVIGLLLREVGDGLKEKEEELKKAISAIFWNYGFFERLIRALLTRLGFPPSTPQNPQSQTSDRKQIAVTCEITSRLSAVDTLPTNRLLGLGARYLREHHSAWARQQGGYEEAFYSDNEDDDDTDVQ